MNAPVIAGAAAAAVLALPVGGLLLLAPASSGSCSAAPSVDGHYTQDQIAQLWRAEHGPADQAQTAGAVGMAESHGDPDAVGIQTPHGRAIGLMQILGAVLPGDLHDPRVNLANAVAKYKASKKAHGEGWLPWTTWTSGAYLQFMGDAAGGATAPPCAPTGPVLAGLTAEADRMTSLDQPYRWGGGHATFDPDGPWDCSGAISQLLHSLGMLNGSPLTSGDLMSWGEPGRGEEFTVYASPDHVFLIVETGPHKGDAWGTATRDLEGQPGSGPLWHHHTTAGFVARHYGGTS